MATAAGIMSSGVQTNPQWVPCDGRSISGYAPMTARPHTGVSTGTQRDLWRNARAWCRTRGIGGWRIDMPRDKNATFKVSIADDNVEGNIASPPTVQNPPVGVT